MSRRFGNFRHRLANKKRAVGRVVFFRLFSDQTTTSTSEPRLCVVLLLLFAAKF